MIHIQNATIRTGKYSYTEKGISALDNKNLYTDYMNSLKISIKKQSFTMTVFIIRN